MQPEIWATGLAAEDEELHDGQPEEEAQEGELAVCDECTEEDNEPPLPEDVPAAVEPEPATVEHDDAGGDEEVAAPDQEEELLIEATRSRAGRKRRSKRRYPIEDYV